MWLFLILTLITAAITMAFYSPHETRSLIAELKRQLRLWVTRQSGERAMQRTVKELFQRVVRAGHDPNIVKEIIEENWDIIRDRLGKPVADNILGEPSSLERYS